MLHISHWTLAANSSPYINVYPRLNHGWSDVALGGAFLCSWRTSKKAKLRIQLCLLMTDPLNSLPTILNSLNITDAQVEVLIT